jgi:protoheme IX farnesyltransferase
MKIDAASREPRAPPRRALALAADYWELARPRIVGMVLCTLTVSSLVAGPQTPSWPALIHALVGCGLVIVGAIALNGRAERQSDAKMRRTAVRPLPSGRLTAGQAGRFGVAASAGGLVYWGVLGNWTLLGLTAVSWFLYVIPYTPLKPRSAWQTPLGALAGAMPVLLGAATAGTPWSYGLAAIALGPGYAGTSLHFFHCRDQRSARLLLPCSLVYLVGVLAALLVGVGRGQ